MEGRRVHHPRPNNLFSLVPVVFPPHLPSPPIPTNKHQLAAAMKPSSSVKKKNRIQWLGDDSHRRSTFKKRRKGIMKKAQELHILCGVETCAVIYGAGEQEPEVWPSKDEAARICRSFRQMPELHQLRLMRTHAHFLQELVSKKAQQLAHQHDEIADAQARCYLYDGLLGADLRGLTRESLVRLHGIIQDMLREFYERCTELRARRPRAASRSLMPSPAELPPAGDVRMSSNNGEAPMEALVTRFLYGEGVEPAEGNNRCPCGGGGGGGVGIPLNS